MLLCDRHRESTHRDCVSKVPSEVALQETCLADTDRAQDDDLYITVETKQEVAERRCNQRYSIQVYS